MMTMTKSGVSAKVWLPVLLLLAGAFGFKDGSLG